MRSLWGIALPFSHPGLSEAKLLPFFLCVLVLCSVNFQLYRMRRKGVPQADFARLPNSWQKYWNRDGVRRQLFRENFRSAIAPVGIWFNSAILILSYCIVRYPAESMLDRAFNRWIFALCILTMLFLSQVLRQVRPPMRPVGIRLL